MGGEPNAAQSIGSKLEQPFLSLRSTDTSEHLIEENRAPFPNCLPDHGRSSYIYGLSNSSETGRRVYSMGKVELQARTAAPELQEVCVGTRGATDAGVSFGFHSRPGISQDRVFQYEISRRRRVYVPWLK